MTRKVENIENAAPAQEVASPPVDAAAIAEVAEVAEPAVEPVDKSVESAKRLAAILLAFHGELKAGGLPLEQALELTKGYQAGLLDVGNGILGRKW